MYDVVVIGSGLGGLICARQLAQSGRSVVVLEAHWQPGGCLQSYRRQGHAIDTGLHYVGGLAPGQPLHSLFSQLGLLRLPWHRLDSGGFDHIMVNGRTFRFAEGYDSFVDTLAADFPHERKALQRYVQMLQGSDPDPSTGAWPWLCKNFNDPLLIDVIAGSCIKTELQRESLPLLAFAHSQKSFIESSWRLKGDSSLMVNALVQDIRRFGGKVVCRAEVEQLVEREGRIVAARCSNGETYKGGIFVSDIHPAQTMALVDNDRIRKSIFSRRLSMLENTKGMYTTSIVLKPKTLPYFNHNIFVYGEGSVWDERTQRVMLSCRVPDDGSPYATLLDLLSPSAADPFLLAETAIPRLRSMVETQYVSTPHTWQRFTHTPGGSAYGIRKDYRSPLLTMLSPRTPIANLFLTGQNVMLHGVEGVTMTAMQTVDLVMQSEINSKP